MHDLHSTHTSTVLLKARCNFYLTIFNNSFLLLLAFKPLQTKKIFQLCTFSTEAPQQACNSLWLSPSCSATFYLSRLSQRGSSQPAHGSADQSDTTALQLYILDPVCLTPPPTPGSKLVPENPFHKLVCIFAGQTGGVQFNTHSKNCKGPHTTALLLRFSLGKEVFCTSSCQLFSHLTPRVSEYACLCSAKECNG